MKRVSVGLGVNGDRANAELAAGTDHPERHLAPVGDEDLVEHAGSLKPKRQPAPLAGAVRCDAEEHLAVLDRLGVLNGDLAHDARHLRLQLVHELHRL